MNSGNHPSWSSSEQYDAMTSVSEQGFADFLDLGDVDLDFNFDAANAATTVAEDSQQLSDLAESLNVHSLPSSGNLTPSQGRLPQGMSQHQHHPNLPGHSGANIQQGHGSNMFAFNVQPYTQVEPRTSFQIQHGHDLTGHAAIPPTPNSVEMHRDTARYLQQYETRARAVMEQQQRYNMRPGDGAPFTPLVSPAVNPQETRLHEVRMSAPSEYTVPGAYFSPLSSPAIEAQIQAGRHSHQHFPSAGSSSTSLADMDVDMLGDSATSQADQSRKARGKRVVAPRQSPAQRAQSRRKPKLNTAIPPKEVSDLTEELHSSISDSPRGGTNALQLPMSRDGSESNSISPEPLSEALMGPPPRPKSNTASPSIVARRGHPSSAPQSQGIAPATPASLMRLQSPPRKSKTVSPSLNTGIQFSPGQPTPTGPPLLDDLVLPSPATSTRPSLTRVDTAILDDQATPRISARKTPKLGPQSTPGGSQSSKPSPSISGMASPAIASPIGAGRPESRSGRSSKKRSSVSSTALTSPAIRPKISPNIKPLLKEGATSDAAMLLASKSNYQHILEGTHVPGVTYPDSLSTNLTQKRTSHKIAEQGRRNRINTALQEMQNLLPPKLFDRKGGSTAASPSDDVGAKDEAESNGKGGTQGLGNSKAAIVESAIEYIKFLKKRDEERTRTVDQKEKEIDELRQRIKQLEARLGEGEEEGHNKQVDVIITENTPEASATPAESTTDTEMKEGDTT